MSFATKLLSLSEFKPVARSFVHEGEKIEFFVKRLSAGEVEDIGERTIQKKGKDSSPVRFRSRMIAKAVCDEDGKEQIPLNVAVQLSNDLSKKLWDEVSEVNGFDNADEDEDAGEASPETTDSD
jgi:hypothetical protein